MKNTSRIIWIAVIALFFSGSLLAQRGKGDPAKHAAKMTQKMVEKLALNEAQTEKVTAINQAFAQKMSALHQAEGERSEKRTEMESLRSELEKEIQTVLTAEQLATWKTMKPKHRGGKHKHGKHGKAKMSKEDRKAVKAYRDTNIKPVLLEQRAKLETEISTEDKALIADLRTKMAAKKTAMKAEKKAKKAERKAKKAEGKKPTEEEREAMHKERKAKREAMRNSPEKKQIEALVAKYGADIESLMAEISEQREQWEVDMKAMRKAAKGKAKAKGKNKGKRKDCEDCEAGKGKRKHKGEKGRKHGKEMKAAHFLLLDPNERSEESTRPASRVEQVSVFPNPTTGSSQLTFNLTESNRVVIELRDKEGNVLKELKNAEMVAGSHNLSVDFGGLASGIYYITIKDETGNVVSKKVLTGM